MWIVEIVCSFDKYQNRVVFFLKVDLMWLCKLYSYVTFRSKFGQLGPGKGQFNSPHGFCLGMDEDIVVADTNNHRIQIFEKTGDFKYQFGQPGICSALGSLYTVNLLYGAVFQVRFYDCRCN